MQAAAAGMADRHHRDLPPLRQLVADPAWQPPGSYPYLLDPPGTGVFAGVEPGGADLVTEGGNANLSITIVQNWMQGIKP